MGVETFEVETIGTQTISMNRCIYDRNSGIVTINVFGFINNGVLAPNVFLRIPGKYVPSHKINLMALINDSKTMTGTSTIFVYCSANTEGYVSQIFTQRTYYFYMIFGSYLR